MQRVIGCLTILLILSGSQFPIQAISFDAAPILQLERTEDDASFMRAAGPIFERSRTPAGERQLLAIRPLWSRFDDNIRERVVQDLLWPIGSQAVTKLSLRRRFLLAFHRDYDRHTENDQYYFYLLPLYFQGISEDDKSYKALFPVVGSIHDFVSYDKIRFFAFPLYLNTQKGEIEGNHYLWPFVSSISGPEVKKRRIFPLAGYSEHAMKSKRYFLLWPFINWGHSLDPEKQWRGLFVMPFFGTLASGSPDSGDYRRKRSLLWPFFSIDKSESAFHINCPWPFFQKSRFTDDPKTGKLYFWPIYGRKVDKNKESRFAVWPIYQRYINKSRETVSTRTYFFPFYWSFISDNADGGHRSYKRYWPLMSVESTSEGFREVKMFDWWPQRKAEPVERNWAPFWTFYHSFRDAQSKQTDVLWGLYQRVSTPTVTTSSLFPFYSYSKDSSADTKMISLLGGVWKRSKGGDKSRTRLFWIFEF